MFQHEGTPVRHAGLLRALYRWLDRLPDGQVILRLDGQRFAHVDVDDTPLVARAARVDGGSVVLALSDGAEEPLNPASVTIDDQGVMRCGVRGGRLEARLATSAACLVADFIEEGPSGPTLTLPAGRFALRGR